MTTTADEDNPGRQPSSLAEIAMLRTQRDPSTPFIMTLDEGEPYRLRVRSYGEISATARRLAATLAAAGVGPGERVGCYLPNAPCWVVASMATWWNGAAVAAVGTLLPPAEAARLFSLADVRIVVAADDVSGMPAGFEIIIIDDEGVIRGSDPVSAPDAAIEPVVPKADELAAIFFTSGTTGQPKGITYTHHDCVAAATRVAGTYARTVAYRPDPAPGHLAPGVVFNPFGHTAGLSRLAFRMWIGRPTVLVRKFSVGALRAYLRNFQADSLQLTPTMIHMLASSEEPLDLGGVKYVTSGTAPLTVATRELFERRFGVPVMQTYGTTEIGVVAQERLDDVRAGRRGPGSVGRLAEGVEVRIRPIEQDRPPGEGEILARTRALPDVFVGGVKVPVDDDGWFATGDVGRFDDDGILYITGRVQDKVIVGGFNVYPAEVEDSARRSPLVSDIVVVGVADDRLGELPVAGIVWAGRPDEEALIRHMRTELASYKVPRAFFVLHEVPLTARGKVDRRQAVALANEALGTRHAGS